VGAAAPVEPGMKLELKYPAEPIFLGDAVYPGWRALPSELVSV
jgi:hypothetical protein